MKSYTVKEVAELLQVNPETVRRWIRDKKLNAQKASNKGGNKILESELKAFLKTSPAYVTSLSSLLVGGIAASAVMLTTYATEKAIEANELRKSIIDRDAIVSFIQSEIASREVLVKRKKESVLQIKKEIAAEQDRINELEKILMDIKNTQLLNEGGEENG